MKHRVLIVEDEPLLRDLIASHLSLNGFHVTEAKDGIECLRLMSQSMPDLVLMDMNMPAMNGISVLRELADLGVTCPVIMVTASTEQRLLSEARELGVQLIC